VTSASITLRQLRYYVALGEELSYRRAAERLFISQPALSIAIKQLEHQLGVPQFTRSTREVTLTDHGADWLPEVRAALAGAELLFRMLADFEAAYPEITVEATEYDFADPTAGLADGSADVAIIRPPVDLTGHRMFVLDSEQRVACLPRDHRLAGHQLHHPGQRQAVPPSGHRLRADHRPPAQPHRPGLEPRHPVPRG
jgi:DNA-binding transcriptional LysR family regulator